MYEETQESMRSTTNDCNYMQVNLATHVSCVATRMMHETGTEDCIKLATSTV